MDRLEQKYDFFVKLGAFIAPLQHLAENPNLYDEQEEARVLGRSQAEQWALIHGFDQFTKGEPGHSYANQSLKFNMALSSIASSPDVVGLQKRLANSLPEAKAAISAVPIPKTSIILEAGSPFTAYCKLKDLCEADTSTSLFWQDPYFDGNLFHRFLRNVKDTVQVTLIAAQPGPRAGRANVDRWNAFLDASQLYAQERGSALYRLIVSPSLHDRWIVFDNKRFYQLGGSAKDAANHDYFSIASLDASPNNLQAIQDTINNGQEWFGPSTPAHRIV